MNRTLADARRWTTHGTKLLLDRVVGLDETGFTAPSGLPGWTRKHLLAHVAANADALGNLVRWAATGVETPMYSSPQSRAAAIEEGAVLSAIEIGSWLSGAAASLDQSMDRLGDKDWSRTIRTAQARLVPATEIPWLRAREVMVHAIDLDCGLAFSDLPEDFLQALVADITLKRVNLTVPDAALSEVAAWLAGRPHNLADAPHLDPWL